MNYKHFGVYLRELRESRNLTREQLAANICTAKQIYRIEKGTYEPSLYLLNQLSIKFNLDLNTYYKMHFAHLSYNAYEVILEINHAIQSYNMTELLNLIHKYENHPDYKEGNNLKTMCYAKALCSALLDNDYETSISYCMKGITTEIPEFSLDVISNYYYSNIAISMLNCLSKNYHSLNQFDISIGIVKGLIGSIEHFVIDSPYNFHNITDYVKQIYQLLLYNLSSSLNDLGDTEESLNYIEKGISFAKQTNNLRYLPELLAVKFQVLYNKGDIVNAKALYQQTQTLLQITDQIKKLELVNKYVREEYPELLEP